MACELTNLAIQYRFIAPPRLHVHLGELHLVALTVPELAKPSLASCRTYPSSCTPYRTYDLYTIWLVDSRQKPVDPNAAFQRLVALPLK
jgi:hypothetical protein